MPNFIRPLVLSLLTLSLATPTLITLAHASDGTLAGLFAQKQKSKFLPVHEAFVVSATQKGDTLTVQFVVTPEHYIYKDKLKLTLPHGVSGGEWTFDKTHTMIDDPEFGRVAVFEESVSASTKLVATTDINNAPISVRWQGCAKAGLCYPPETTKTTITLTAPKVANQNTDKKSEQIAEKQTNKATLSPSIHHDNELKDTLNDELGAVPATTPNSTPTEKLSLDEPTHTKTQAQNDVLTDKSSPIVSLIETGEVKPNSTTNSPNEASQNKDDETSSNNKSHASVSNPATQNLATPNNLAPSNHTALLDKPDPFGINKNPLLAVLLLFLAGLLLSFTPCVYPMIPIVANIVAHNKTKSAVKGLALSGSYGFGVATAYGVLGAVIAWLGQTVGILGLLQNPYILGVFAIIFALLALYMFDIIKINLPSKLRNLLQQKSQSADDKLGSIAGSFIAGGLSALVVSPCVSAPMAGALTAVSSSGNPFFGFIALFSLGLGLSLPLMFIGLAQGKFMPKAGEWMNRVKEFCGLLLLAVSLSLLERLIFTPLMLIIWAVWFAICAVWLFRMKNLASQGFALIAGLWAVCLVAGAGMGAVDAWRPLSPLSTTTTHTSHAKSDLKITTLAELDPILSSNPKVLVDLTADWCVECRIMERTLFTNRPAVLSDYQVVKLDITDTNEHSRAVLSRYGLFGPPALLIYKDNQLQTIMTGEVARRDFEEILAKF